MSGTQDGQGPAGPASLFRSHLPTIDRLAEATCRRHGLFGDQAEDFRAWVHLRLIDGDYAVLRKFRGKSSLSTYLTVVIQRLFRDFHIAEHGRWRPSAAAQRLGQVAVQLETLLCRYRYPVGEAISLLRSNGAADRSERKLRELAASLPARPLRRAVGGAELERMASHDRADSLVERSDVMKAGGLASTTLEHALGELPAEERLLIKLRFQDGLAVADIARLLKTPQKPLYPRIHRILASLRRALEAAGVTRDDVMRMVEWDGAAMTPLLSDLGNDLEANVLMASRHE